MTNLLSILSILLLSLSAAGYSMPHAELAATPTQEQPGLSYDLTIDTPSLLTFWQKEKYIPVTIETDLTALLADRRSEKVFSGSFLWKNGKEKLAWPISLQMRGKFRRMNCDFPPLHLKFGKSDLQAIGLAPFNKFKLTTHCDEDAAKADQIVLREYLAYRLYNDLTDRSFRVQLLRITWRDSSKKMPSVTHWGFLLENTDELAQRLNSTAVDAFSVLPETLEPKQQQLVWLFQYLICNTDWQVEGQRNFKLFQPSDEQTVYGVPYDFDFSGLVAAPYALPKAELGQSSIRQRVYQGADIDQATMDWVLSRQKQWEELIWKMPGLSPEVKKDLRAYVVEGFQQLAKGGYRPAVHIGR